jgi:hypothetical protein
MDLAAGLALPAFFCLYSSTRAALSFSFSSSSSSSSEPKRSTSSSSSSAFSGALAGLRVSSSEPGP